MEKLRDRKRGISNPWGKGMMAYTLLLFLYSFVFLLQIKASLRKGIFQAKLILSFNHFQMLITLASG